MFKLVLHLLLVKLAFTESERQTESFDILETLNLLSPPVLRTPSPRQLDLNKTCFSSLDNYQVNAKPAEESKYRWIARVIHSRSADVPHMCTAVCIDEAIFITAARCIYTLKVRYTTIMYMSKRFEARVFVVPSKPTKQMFDDVGIIVVNAKKVKNMNWAVIKLFNVVNRTDGVFQWFADLNKNGNIKYKVVGYTMKKGIHKVKSAEKKYDLTELDVVAAHDICFKILEQYRKANGFGVPCYHSCTYAQFEKNNAKCKQYHGVEGGAVVDTTTNKLIGIATWGVYFSKYELPVGFSIVNSENFFKDLTCAKRIREDNGMLVTKGYYQSLCDGNE